MSELTEQERDQAKEEVLRAISGSPNRSLMKQMLDDSEQRVAELETAVLALADEWTHPQVDLPLTRSTVLAALRALVSDPTALDRVRQDAVEAALTGDDVLEAVADAIYAERAEVWTATSLARVALAAARDAARDAAKGAER